MKTSKGIFLACLSLLAIGSCKKDVNFDKFNDSFIVGPEMGLPIAQLSLNMSDLLKEDSIIKYDPDGLIRFIIKEDTLAQFNADTFVKLPTVNPVNIKQSLGEASIDNYAYSTKRTLSELAAGFSPATTSALNAAAGNVTTFPAINDQNNTVTSFPNQGANFTNVTISRGFLVVEFRNRLPVVIDQLTLNLYSQIPFQSLVGQLNFLSVPPSGSKKDSINLAGKIISNSLAYTMPVFKTLASPSPVLVNLNDSVSIVATTTNLKAISGNAIFPAQNLNSQTIDVEVDADDPSVRIRHGKFVNTRINYSVSSTVKEQLRLTIKLPGATLNGNPFQPIIINTNNNTVTGSIDISGVDFDLTQVPSQPYNKMKVLVEPEIIASGVGKDFDSSDYVIANFSFPGMNIDHLDGFMGMKTVTINPESIDFDAFNDIDAGLNFNNPQLTIKTSNSIGIPILVNLDIEGKSKTGTVQKLNGPTFTMAYPTTSQAGQTINGTFTYTKSNSDIDKLVSLPPNNLTFSGTATVNKDGFNGYNDFIDRTGKIVVGYEMNMPFDLKTTDLSLQDSTDNPLLKKEDASKEYSLIVDLDSGTLDYVEMVTRIDNGFPFDGTFKLYFADSNYVIQDSIIATQVFKAAIPDVNGKVATNTISKPVIRISYNQMLEMKKKRLVKMIYRATMSTYNSGSVPVKIYSTYQTKIGISVKVKAKNLIK